MKAFKKVIKIIVIAIVAVTIISLIGTLAMGIGMKATSKKTVTTGEVTFKQEIVSASGTPVCLVSVDAAETKYDSSYIVSSELFKELTEGDVVEIYKIRNAPGGVSNSHTIRLSSEK